MYEILREIADAAERRDDFWKEFQFRALGSNNWLQCKTVESIFYIVQNRPNDLRPMPNDRFIRTDDGEYSFPNPLTAIPQRGFQYWSPAIVIDELIIGYTWYGDDTDYMLLWRGLVHSTRNDALEHAWALIEASRSEP